MLSNTGIYFPIQKYRFLQKLYFFVIIYHMVREFFLVVREHSAKDSTWTEPGRINVRTEKITQGRNL
jgi:hypothetical protein